MPSTLEAQDYRRLFVDDIPMIDLRAPIEFTQGAFASSTSLPLMSDLEREAVGTCYKQEGQDAAIKLGHELVSGELKATRIAAWKAFIDANPHGALYCFRGGKRSQFAQQWLNESQLQYPLVPGGYKQMRNHLLDKLDYHSRTLPFTLVSGKTGSGNPSGWCS